MANKRRLVKRRVLSIRTTNPLVKTLRRHAAEEGVTMSDLANRWLHERAAVAEAELRKSASNDSQAQTSEARAA